MLLIRYGHLFPRILLEDSRDRVISNRKSEDLWHRPRQIGHGKLAFPRFAQPPFLGNLLDITSSFAHGISVAEGYPDPESNDHRGNDKKNEQGDQQLVALLFYWNRGSRGFWCVRRLR